MGNTINVGNLVATVSADTSGLTSGVESMAGAFDKMKGTVDKLKVALTALMTNPVVLAAAAIASLVALGKAAYDAYIELDNAYEAIEVGTGAVGESLDGLKTSFDNVFANNTYIESADELAGVIADLNTYLGVTGTELETLAGQIENMNHMGVETSVSDLSKAFNKWGVETQDMSGYLDYFFQICQNTGISMDSLTGSLTQSQTVLSQFGFSLEESAELIGNMNKAGFESSSISTAFTRLIASGVTTKEAFFDLVNGIQTATDETEAFALAEAFGTRNMVEMKSIIESGAFNNLGAQFEDSAGAIEATAKSTEDFSDKMERAKRGVQEFMSKAGAVINDVLGKLFDVGEYLFGLAEKIFEPIKKLFTKIGESFSKFWNDGKDSSGEAIDGITAFIENLVDVISTALDFFLEYIYPAIEVYIEYIVDLVKAFCALISGDFDTMWEYLSKAATIGMTLLYTILQKAWNFVAEGIEYALQGIVDFIFGVINSVISVVESAVNGVINMINTFIGGVNGILDFLGWGQISAVGTVDWQLDTPDLTNFVMRFEDTAIGNGMEEFIGSNNANGNGSKSSLIQNITINGDVTDAYDTAQQLKQAAIDQTNNPTLSRG